MPELPEVETVRRRMAGVLEGRRISSVEAVEDGIVFGDTGPAALEAALTGRLVTRVGRKGKYWWLETDEGPCLVGHLGMAGWVRDVGPTREAVGEELRLMEHGRAPLDDASGRPKFLKLMIEAKDGGRIALTDGRRLARVRLCNDPNADPGIAKLGPDCLEEPRTGQELRAVLAGRSAPIKALLLDQTLFAGVGNWVADEALYMARIAPQRSAGSLSRTEAVRLAKALVTVLQTAVEAGADHTRYPEGWMFHSRWGGKKGHQRIGGRRLVREQVGGRTTAWVPGWQR